MGYGDQSPGFDSVSFGAFGVFGVIFAVVFVGILIFAIISVVRNVQRASASGHDPMTMQTDLAVRALDSELLAPSRSTAEKLAELDALFAAGTITEAERAAARARILGG